MKRFLVVLVAMTVAGVASARQPPESATARFDIPVWHPDARWELAPSPFALDTNLRAHLDGPRHELMWGHPIYPRLHGGFQGVGRYVFMSYDDRTDRYHAITGGAAGYLDGPFSRARFYVEDYHAGRHERAWSPDARFYYMLASFYGQRIRSLDFAEQMVRTLPVEGLAFACGDGGKVYAVQGHNPAETFAVLSPGPEWKLLRTGPLQGHVKLSALGTSLAVDEQRDRLYGTTYRAEPSYVWYWDLEDGSLHGVLPNSAGQPDARQQGEAGPFRGTVLYNHGEICWGPDDPQKRFLYVTRVDDANLYRLDLDREIISVFSAEEGRFVDEGKGDGSPLYVYPPHWFPDGSFLGFVPWYMSPPQCKFFKRVQ